MKTLAKYHVCNHCVIGEKTFQNILIALGKLPGLFFRDFRETGPSGNLPGPISNFGDKCFLTDVNFC